MCDVMSERDLRPETTPKHRLSVPYTVATPYPVDFQPVHRAE